MIDRAFSQHQITMFLEEPSWGLLWSQADEILEKGVATIQREGNVDYPHQVNVAGLRAGECVVIHPARWSRRHVSFRTKNMTFYPYYGAQRPVPYLLYQQASDPDLRIDACCKRIASFAGADLLDIGAGNGFHALRFARQCRRVTAVEPDPAMRAQCMAALTSFGQPTNLVVLAGHAAALPIPDHSVDIVHARYAYFFGTDACLPGLAEVRRVLRPGGSCFVIESSNLGDMGRLYRDYFPAVFTNQDAVIDFWGRQGFTQYLVETVWSVPDRATMAAAFALEHDPQQVQEILDRIPGTSLSYVARVFHWRQPGGAS